MGELETSDSFLEGGETAAQLGVFLAQPFDHFAVVAGDRFVAFGTDQAAEEAHAAAPGDHPDSGGEYRFPFHECYP